jgi:hypothetical protein
MLLLQELVVQEASGHLPVREAKGFEENVYWQLIGGEYGFDGQLFVRKNEANKVLISRFSSGNYKPLENFKPKK